MHLVICFKIMLRRISFRYESKKTNIDNKKLDKDLKIIVQLYTRSLKLFAYVKEYIH